MATVAEVRALLGDTPKYGSFTGTGDGANKIFRISQLPVIDASEVVKVNGSVMSAYTLDEEIGLLTFTAAPGNALPVTATFSFVELSDASITTILSLQSSAYGAAAAAARSLAGKYSSQVDKQIGDLRKSYSQAAKAWAELAKSLQRNASRSGSIIAPWAGGISRSDKRANEADTDLVTPAFTITMQNSPENGEEPTWS